MTTGIYRIAVDIGRGKKFYIGQAKCIEVRRTVHFRSLTNGSHYNHALQEDFNKFGIESVSFDVLVKCQADRKLLAWYEQMAVDLYAECDLYNIRRLCVLTPLGTSQSLESNAKRSVALIGIKRSQESIAKSAMARTGVKRTKEQRERISASLKGRKLSPEHRAKSVAALQRSKSDL